MNAEPSAANSVQLTYTRSWNGVHELPAVRVAQAVGVLSTVISCLSRNGEMPLPVTSLLARTYRPGKFQDAPLFCVERKTTRALEVSELLVVGRPRLNSWQLR